MNEKISSSNKRLAIHVPDLSGGGAERMMANLANEIASRGIKVDLVVSQKKGAYLSEINDSVTIIDLSASRYPIFEAMGSFLPLRKYMKNKNPDVFLSVLSLVNIVSILAYTTSSVDFRIVVSQRNHLSSIASNNGKGMKIVPCLVRCTYPLADAIIPISEGVASDLQNITGISTEKMDVIYNPVVTNSISDLVEEPLDHPWLNENENDLPVVLGVGRLAAQKDFPTLIRSFNILRKKRECRLIILGKGNKRTELNDLIQKLGLQDCVDMPGFVDNPFAYPGTGISLRLC